MISWKTEQRVISDLIPHPHNPRQMTEKQVKQLKASLEKFNLAEIPAINTDNTILAGHQRLKIMQMLGRGNETIDVRVPTRELTKEEADEYLVRSNKNTGEWDFDILANEWEFTDLEEWGFDLDDLKIHLDHEVEEDEAPEVSSEPAVSQLGEVYQLGRHRVMCGDSTKIEDVEKLMDGEKAELLFTSPPYADMREYNGGKDLSVEHLATFIPTYKMFVEYQVVNLGLQLKDGEINQYWDEYVLSARNAEFPVELPAEYIKAMTNEGSGVIDPFGGAGSTLIAAEQLKRTSYIMELDPNYVDVIRKRYAKFIGKEDEWLTITPKL